MGGKTKQSQRTKNNARPSSSWRSAELLTNSVGFSGVLSPSGANAEATLFTSITENTIQTLGNEYILCVKKLNKKDPTSKTKGLQELTELIKRSNNDDISEFLQHWSRLYPILSNDLDHKVREATQICHGAVCVASGRTLCRVLRPLAPVWICAQYDAYPPAATAAAHALTMTFPGDKMRDFILYTCNDLLSYIITNVIHNDPQNIRRQEESEDCSQVRYTSLCVCCLRAVCLLTTHNAQLQWTQIAQLPKAHKYWKLPNAPLLRSAWLRATAAIMERFPLEFNLEFGNKCAKHLLTEANSNCDAHVWQCLLTLLKHTKNDGMWEEQSKQLTNRIMELAEDGGAGTSALLLPVAAAIPSCMRTKPFYAQYMNAMLRGVDKKCIVTSKSERLARITSLGDCLEYVCASHGDEFGSQYITGLQRVWLQCALRVSRRPSARAHIVGTTAARLAELLRTWTTAGRDQLVRQLWLTTASVIATAIARADAHNLTNLEHTATDHALFLATINDHTSAHKHVKTISFDDETCSSTATPAQCATDLTTPTARPAQCATDLTTPTARPAQCTNDLTTPAATPAQCANDLTTPAATPAQCANDLTTPTARPAQCTNDLTTPAATPAQCANDLTTPAATPAQCTNDLTTPAATPAQCANDLTTPAATPAQCANDLTTPTARPAQCANDLTTPAATPAQCANDLTTPAATPAQCANDLTTPTARPAQCTNDLTTPAATPAQCANDLTTPTARPAQCTNDLTTPAATPAQCANDLTTPAATPAQCANDLTTPTARPAQCTNDLTTPAATPAQCANDLTTPTAMSAQYAHDATNLTQTIILKYFEYISSHRRAMAAVLRPLTPVLRACHGEGLYARLCAHMECESPLALCEALLRWLNEADEEGAAALVDVVVLLVDHLCEEDRNVVFARFAQLGPSASELLVCACVRAYVGGGGEWCAEWVRAAGDILRRAARRGRAGDDAIEHAFTHDKNGELVVCEATVGAVLDELVARVRRAEGTEAAVRLCGRVMSASAEMVTHECVRQPYEALVQELFAVALQGETNASEAAWCWRDALWAVCAKDKTRANKMMHQVAAMAKRQLLSVDCDINEIDRVATICSHMMDTSDLAALADTLDALTEHRDDAIESLAVHYDCIISKLNCPDESPDRIAVPPPSAVREYCTLAAFGAVVVKNALLGPTHGHVDAAVRCTRALSEPRLAHHYLGMLRAAVVCETLREALVYSYRHHAPLHRATECVYACVEMTVSALNCTSLSALTRALDSMRPLVLHWSYCAKLLYQLSREDDHHDYGDTEHQSYYHALQAKDDPRKCELIALHNLERTYPEQTAAVIYTSGVMDYIVELYYKCEDIMLLDRELGGCSWAQLLTAASVAECMRWQVDNAGWQMSASQWDFVNIALCGLVNSLQQTTRPERAAVAMLCRSTLKLLQSVAAFVSSVRARCLIEQPHKHIADLPAEWRDVFEPNITDNMLKILLNLFERAVSPMMMCPPLHVYLSAVRAALPIVRHSALPAPRREQLSAHHILNICVRTLSSPVHYLYKYIAHTVIVELANTFLDNDAQTLSINNSEEYDDDSADGITPEAIESCFVNRCMGAHAALYTQLSACDREELLAADSPDGHSGVLGAILLSHALIGATLGAKGDLALLYVRAYCENKMVKALIDLSLRLVPDALCERRASDWPSSIAGHFSDDTRQQLREPPNGAMVSELSCRSVWLAAHCKAAAGDAEIDELVAKYVSPAVIRAHLGECASLGDDTLHVSVLMSTREVQCLRKLDDSEARLTLTLSAAHPLRAPRVMLHSGPPLYPHQHFLAHQRGNVRNAVLWWAASVHKWVSRAPVCCVCYCRLQGGRLPQAGCKVCKHKFHAQCLQRWFNTSKDPKCPLCRSPFVNHSMYNVGRPNTGH